MLPPNLKPVNVCSKLVCTPLVLRAPVVLMEAAHDDGVHLPSLLDRVVDENGFRATVRYVGPVCTAKDPASIWIGESFGVDIWKTFCFDLQQVQQQ